MCIRDRDAADTITGNCDCTLFLGGKEKSTLKEISEVLGKETIDLYNTSETRSNNNSYGLNYQKTGKELMLSLIHISPKKPQYGDPDYYSCNEGESL